MKLIPLTQGYFAQVDDEDYDYLITLNWHVQIVHFRKYAVCRINGKGVYMHRLILKPEKGYKVDHIKGEGLNNQKHNLRVVTHAQNMANRKPSKNGSSKYLGVSRYIIKASNGKEYLYWSSELNSNRVRYRIGRFKTEIEAAKAYNQKAIELHGEFARLNTFD